MFKSVLIIVPHPDDEINLAGGLFQQFVENNIHCTVVFCTNGDYEKKYAQQRYLEVLKAKRIFGYNDAIFLGYGDGLDISHLYDLPDDQPIDSICGKTETYCAGPQGEYCYIKTGCHHAYTRGNLKSDIKSVVLDTGADLIICVDNDCHYDHRCVSLLFDEAMGEVLKESQNYVPIILKGFAYMGTWAGIDDFFSHEIQPLKPTVDGIYCDLKNVYPYSWEERIRIKNGARTTTMLLWKNSILKAILAHRSQCRYPSANDNALVKFPRIANPESCFWLRRTDNLVLHSKIVVSSGNASYLNDFKLCDTNSTGYLNYYDDEQGWTPSETDDNKTIKIVFNEKRSIRSLIIHQGLNTRILSLEVSGDDGFKKVFTFDFTMEAQLVIPIKISSVELMIKILSYAGRRLCINEIECFDGEPEKGWFLDPLKPYVDLRVTNPPILTLLEGTLFHLFAFLLISIKKIPIKFRLILGIKS